MRSLVCLTAKFASGDQCSILLFVEGSVCQVNSQHSSSDCRLESQMEEDESTASKEVFSEVQKKAITGMVEGLLKKVLKDCIGALQLEIVVGLPYLRNKR